MATSLTTLKKKISSTSKILEVVEAMRLVSSAKLKRYEKLDRLTSGFDAELKEVYLTLLPSLSEDVQKTYFEKPEKGKKLIIYFTSNLGLCGAYNSNVIKYLETLNYENAEVLPLGKKGAKYYQDKAPYYQGEMSLEANAEEISLLANSLLKDYLDGKYNQIEVVYSVNINALDAVVTKENLLPLMKGEMKEVDGVAPLIDGEPDEVFSALLPSLLSVKLRRMQVQAIRAEQSLRRKAMEAAKDNGETLLNDLSISYNKARQNEITSDINEVVGAL